MVSDHKLSVKPLSGKRAFEEISDQIRDLIYAKKLKPGDKLPAERELAEKFKAGRTAVREGLRVLEGSGLISIRQGSEGGSFVRDADTSVVSRSIIDIIRRSNLTVDQLIEVKIGVERLVIGPALARMTTTELDLLKENIKSAEAMLDAASREGALPDLDSWVEVNSEFHLILARSTGNPLFEAIVNSFTEVMRSFMKDPPLVPDYYWGHLKHHRAILKAIMDKNLWLAERHLDAHSLWVGQTLTLEGIAGGEPDQ
ncbi:MAG: FCD domain-containing protein [Thermodesulfobacteriota bacterium]